MFSINKLRRQLMATLTKSKVDKLTRILNAEQFNLCHLIDLSFDADPRLAFRAAWLLENALLKHPNVAVEVINCILSRAKEVRNPSCKRHYAKILMHLTSAKAAAPIQYEILHADMEPVVELCFAWIIDPKVQVAVKVHACETLFNLRHRHALITEELPEQLHCLMRNGSAAMQVRGRRLLGLLSQKQKVKIQKV